jgi:hypothetical protein
VAPSKFLEKNYSEGSVELEGLVALACALIFQNRPTQKIVLDFKCKVETKHYIRF